MKAMKKIIGISLFSFFSCITIGGIVFFLMTNKIFNSYSEIRQENEILRNRHKQEISATPNDIKQYTNSEGVTVNIDNCIETSDTIIIDFTVDTNTFIHPDKNYELSDSIINKEREFGTLAVEAIPVGTDFSDDTFYQALVTECFLMSYNLSQHFKYIATDPNASTEYGYLLNEPVKIKNTQVNALFYNDKRKFTLVLNKETVKMVRLIFNYRGAKIESSIIYMLIQ